MLSLPASIASATILYETETSWCAHICGQDASMEFLEMLHSVREASYKTHLKGSHLQALHDPIDVCYSHVLIVDKPTQSILAGMRLMPSRDADCRSFPEKSYLEHSYPGFYASFAREGDFMELSRLFFSVAAAGKFKLYTALFRGIRLLAESRNCHLLTGLASYNHFAHQALSTRYFLTAVQNPSFFERVDLPPPRYPLDFDLTLSTELTEEARAETRINGVERSIQRLGEAAFQISPITRIYLSFMNARIMGFSMGKSYNELTELLIYSDLRTHNRLKSVRAPREQ